MATCTACGHGEKSHHHGIQGTTCWYWVDGYRAGIICGCKSDSR